MLVSQTVTITNFPGEFRNDQEYSRIQKGLEMYKDNNTIIADQKKKPIQEQSYINS